ncbi:hypothetical protein A9995_10920 [Erythrobacter sp. QSSC1-22B]|nr:hypothetical protein A9995_10920 [Erythrobacter sp. QSSC1-22B]
MLPRTLIPLALCVPLALIYLQVQPVSAAQQRETESAKKTHQHQSAARYIAAKYGPFRVICGRLELIRETDAMSPNWLKQVLADHPNLDRLDIVEGPGTVDDIANLQLGRMIREAGLKTHVPSHGSARSGAVELFLAGKERTMESGAEFAVHSWRDDYGRQAGDPSLSGFRKDLYLDYYTDMGMSPRQAHAFYEMTNSPPHLSVRWMEANEMEQWISQYP